MRKLLLTVLIFVGLTSTGLAQEAAANASRTWFQVVYDDGGILMYPLTLCSMAVVGLAILNGMSLAKKKFHDPELEQTLNDHMSQLRVRSALETTNTSPTYLARLAQAGFSEIDGSDLTSLGQDKVEEAFADFATAENRVYLQRLGYFSLLAQISPMLGLLGTVQGMIGAFANLEQNRQNPGILAHYISIALYTTFAGLLIAIPAVILYYYFKNKLNARVGECFSSARHMLHLAQQAANPGHRERLIPEGLSS